MNQTLWNNIEQFDLDNPIAEYGFSIRLAHENNWTIYFTKHAILEYKKFMYLAATVNAMVSPSEIVDIVWHQHLIFTQSYNDFCEILGKKIEHIPSTHNKAEAEKFANAKEKTTILYEQNFGKQPTEFWHSQSMLSGLNIKEAKLNIDTIVIVCTVLLAVVALPFATIVQPLYVQIKNPYFIIAYIAMVVSVLFFLSMKNKKTLNDLAKLLFSNAVISNLSASELIFIETGKKDNIIHGQVNQLLNEGVLYISNKRVGVGKEDIINDAFKQTIISTIGYDKEMMYHELLRRLMIKPIVSNIVSSMKLIEQKCVKSKPFLKLFFFNYIVLATITLIGFGRVLNGILREKPVAFIVIILMTVVIVFGVFLYKLAKSLFSSAIPSLYKKEIIPFANDIKYEQEDWQYFLLGNAFLTASFIPMINYSTNKYSGDASFGTYSSWDNTDGGSGSSCSSDGGSSCGGSGCGGCGGGD